MYKYINQRRALRKKRTLRVRKPLKGTATKPRLSVKKSNKHLFAQLIDDENGITLASFSTMSKGERAKKSMDSAKKIGEKIAELAKKQKVETVIFDRGYAKYHGLLAALATSAREAGLKF